MSRSGEPRSGEQAVPAAGGLLAWRPRSLAALILASVVGLLGFGWPFLLDGGSVLGGHSQDAPFLFVIVLVLVVAVVLAELSEGGMDAKAVAMLGVLAAVGTALRTLSPATAGFEPTFFVLVLAGRVLGAGFGFALGSLVIFTSALVTGGVGPWMPFQMLGLAWTGMFAGCLPRMSGRAERLMLAAYAAVTGFAYGALLNLTAWPFSTTLPPGLGYEPGAAWLANLEHYATFYLTTSLAWDIVRAVVNFTLVLVVGRPVLAALRRAARRAAFDAPVDFTAARR